MNILNKKVFVKQKLGITKTKEEKNNKIAN